MVTARVSARGGQRQEVTLQPDAPLTFGRVGEPGVLGLSSSVSVSRRAVTLLLDRNHLLTLWCGQRVGSLEVTRDNGVVAARLIAGERGVFRTPLRIELHSAPGRWPRSRLPGRTTGSSAH